MESNVAAEQQVEAGARTEEVGGGAGHGEELVVAPGRLICVHPHDAALQLEHVPRGGRGLVGQRVGVDIAGRDGLKQIV